VIAQYPRRTIHSDGDARECFYARTFRHSRERTAYVADWLRHYNWHRRHTSLRGQTPISRRHLPGENVLRLHSYVVDSIGRFAQDSILRDRMIFCASGQRHWMRCSMRADRAPAAAYRPCGPLVSNVERLLPRNAKVGRGSIASSNDRFQRLRDRPAFGRVRPDRRRCQFDLKRTRTGCNVGEDRIDGVSSATVAFSLEDQDGLSAAASPTWCRSSRIWSQYTWMAPAPSRARSDGDRALPRWRPHGRRGTPSCKQPLSAHLAGPQRLRTAKGRICGPHQSGATCLDYYR
jgi:hypothetical protein